jgi:large subunit ribosomal protein L9
VPEAILLKDVEGLGEAGTVVDVSPGYLRNYLAPRKLAQSATSASIAAAQRRLEQAESAAREQSERAQENVALLSKTVLTISHRAGDDGRLFGSVTAKEVADAVQQARGLKIDHRKVRLEEPIRELGTHMVEIEVSEGVTASVKTMVVEEK